MRHLSKIVRSIICAYIEPKTSVKLWYMAGFVAVYGQLRR